MFKKAMLLVLSGILMMNLYGCFALFAGAVGGAGTAIWLSGKLTQEVHASYHAAIDATKLALKSLDLQVVKETDEEKTTQFKGNYSDGREMWIDVNKVSENDTELEVRIGGVNSDKEAASKVIKKIQSYL